MSKVMKKWVNLALSAGLLLSSAYGSTASVFAVDEPLVIEEEPTNNISDIASEETDEDKVKATLEYAEIQEKENQGFRFEYSKHVDTNNTSLVELSLTINIENEKINNVNVLLPDASVSDKTDVEYTAPCNGKNSIL